MAAFAVAAGQFDRDRTKTRLEGARVVGGKAAEGLAADRAHRGRGIGFGLRAAFNRLAEQFPHVLCGLDFEMTEILIACEHEALNRMFQRARRPGGRRRERFARCSTHLAGGYRLKTGDCADP